MSKREKKKILKREKNSEEQSVIKNYMHHQWLPHPPPPDALSFVLKEKLVQMSREACPDVDMNNRIT